MATKKAATASSEKKTLTVIQTGSVVGKTQDVRATLVGLGLRRQRDKRVLEDTPSVRGMIRKVRHIVVVEGE